MKNKQQLYDSLYKLYLVSFEKIIQARDSGKLIKIPYERIKAVDLKFEHWLGQFNYDWENIEYFDRYKWNTDSFVNFADNEIKLLPEYDSAVEEINHVFDIPEHARIITRNSGLFGFIRLLMHQVPNGTIHNGNIENYIDTFISDYETYKGETSFTWHIQAWLGWFYFESDQITIANYLLRKPKIEELSLIRPQSHHIDDFERITSRSLNATSILEFNIIAPTQHVGIYSDEIRQELEACVDVFRLFKVGNVATTQLSVSPYSVLEHGHSETVAEPFEQTWKDKVDYQHISKYEYMVTKEEEPLLISFFEKMKPILHSFSPKSYLNGTYLDLALHRYKDSLLRSQVNVNRLVSAITCLEALMSNSTSEITFKISIHVSGLLRIYGFNTIKVLEKLQKAYNVRSTLIHGSKLNEKLISFADDYTHEIVNYTRVCLLTSLQLEEHYSKDALIKKLDHALIDKDAYNELEEIIRKNVFIPVKYPFRTLDYEKYPLADDFQE